MLDMKYWSANKSFPQVNMVFIFSSRIGILIVLRLSIVGRWPRPTGTKIVGEDYGLFLFFPFSDMSANWLVKADTLSLISDIAK